MVDYHYNECGLNNVVISGLEFAIDDEGDEIIAIPYVNELHRVIAYGIVAHEHGMSKDELRFLRTEIGYTQAELAKLVHHERQSIGRWERGEIQIDGAAEAIIRRLAIEKLGLENKQGIDELSKFSVPRVEPQKIAIQASDGANYELKAA